MSPPSATYYAPSGKTCALILRGEERERKLPRQGKKGSWVIYTSLRFVQKGAARTMPSKGGRQEGRVQERITPHATAGGNRKTLYVGGRTTTKKGGVLPLNCEQKKGQKRREKGERTAVDPLDSNGKEDSKNTSGSDHLQGRNSEKKDIIAIPLSTTEKGKEEKGSALPLASVLRRKRKKRKTPVPPPYVKIAKENGTTSCPNAPSAWGREKKRGGKGKRNLRAEVLPRWGGEEKLGIRELAPPWGRAEALSCSKKKGERKKYVLFAQAE